MALTGQIIGAPATVNCTRATLISAINGARPGTTVVQTEAGDPITLDISGQTRSGPMTVVQLHPDQLVQLVCTSGSPNLWFMGGQFGGSWAGGTEYAVSLGRENSPTSSMSKLRISGARFEASSNTINGANVTDFAVTDSQIRHFTADFCQIAGGQRLLFDNLQTSNNPSGWWMHWYNDGRLPDNVTGGPALPGAVFRDSAHGDIIQLRGSSTTPTTDFRVSNCDFRMWGQGLLSFGTPGGDWTRFEIVNNVIRITDFNGIAFVSTAVDGLISGNHFSHPEIGGESVLRILAPGTRIRSGLNTYQDYTTITGDDWEGLFGATLTGDIPTPPTPPDHVIPSWHVAPSRPSMLALTGIPEIAQNPDRLFGTSNGSANVSSAAVGTWITCGRGAWRPNGLTAPYTFEFRWLRNGTLIASSPDEPGGVAPTRQIYRLQTADLGTAVTPQVRIVSAQGTTAWASAPVINVS